MVAPFQVVHDEADCPSPDLLSVIACKDVMFTAAFGKGVYRKRLDGKWLQADEGLPDGVVINRLQTIDRACYACTNKGLFFYDENCWHPTELTIPCYQVAQQGLFFAAATEYGLWCKIGTRWENTACPNLAIYDLLLTPHYYILGTKRGISLYDRYTDSGAEFRLGTAVTSLAAYYGYLLGVTMEGTLIQGNKKGGFSRIAFEGMSIYSLKSTDTGVYVCSSRGLHRFQMMDSRLVLRSMLAGYPVTDINGSGDCMFVATINHGLKKVVLSE